jgi:hypothetical protein
MAIRVVHLGTGNVGRLALAELIANPAFELAGLCVSAAEKVGRDAGELAGLDIVTGVVATDDLAAVLATEPQCAVYCAMGDTRLVEAMSDVQQILAAGVNVVGSAPGVLQFPWKVIPDKFVEAVEEAGRQGGSSIFINGVDPGFVTDLIPLAFAGTCRGVEQVRCMEIADYATYDGAVVMFDVMGFGKPFDEVPLLFQPGVLRVAWGCAIRQLAAGLNIVIDEITESYEREPAPQAFDIAAGHVPKGTVAAVRFEIIGMSGGTPVIVVEHVTRLRGDRSDIYPVTVQFIADHPHSGLPDRESIADMNPLVRHPAPRELTWALTDAVITDFYWLRAPAPQPGERFEATCQNNAVTVSARPAGAGATVFLDARLVDFSKPVTLTVGGQSSTHQLNPSLRTFCETMQRRGDPQLAFSAALPLPAPAK